MNAIYDINESIVPEHKITGKTIGIFIGCDILPNIAHLHIINTLNQYHPREVFILLLKNRKKTTYNQQYELLFSTYLKINHQIFSFDEILETESINKLPEEILNLELSELKNMNIEYRETFTFGNLISTFFEPIALFNRFKIDYLIINPFLKNIYTLLGNKYQEKLIRLEYLTLPPNQNLQNYIDLESISPEVIYDSIIPFTEFHNLKYSEFLKKYKLKDTRQQIEQTLKQIANKLLEIKHKHKKKKIIMTAGDTMTKTWKLFATDSKLRILKYLNQPRTLTEISREVRIAAPTVKMYLDEMIKAELITKSITKKYIRVVDTVDLQLNLD